MNTNHKMKSFILKLMAFICVFGLRNNCISALYVNADSSSSSGSGSASSSTSKITNSKNLPLPDSKFDLDWLASLGRPVNNPNRKYKYYLSASETSNNPPSSLSFIKDKERNNHSLQKRQKGQDDQAAGMSSMLFGSRLPPKKINNNHRQIIYAKTKMNNFKRSGYNNNNNNYYNEMISEPAMSSNTMLRSPRGQRQYDVPQIECPLAMDGMERFACPTPDRQGRYRCIDEHVLCDGFMDCPEAEDEDFKSCMFYKTTKAHLDVVADALLRWARGRR